MGKILTLIKLISEKMISTKVWKPKFLFASNLFSLLYQPLFQITLSLLILREHLLTSMSLLNALRPPKNVSKYAAEFSVQFLVIAVVFLWLLNHI